MKKISKLIPFVIFALAISLFASSFFLQRNFMTDLDERDHLAAGYLMLNGKKLYKDIFTHHFPFPYYWAFLFASFWGNTASRAIAVFRLSLLILYLISFFTVFLCLKNKKSKYALSLWITVFSLFFTLYHGQLLLSETFSAIAIVSMFWLVLPVLLGWEKFTFKKTIASIFFAFIGVWTQPLLFFLFLIPVIMAPKDHRLKTILLSSVVNAVPLLCFLFSNQLQPFLEQGVWFNFAIYPKYYVDLNSRYLTIPILQNLFPFLKNEFNLFTHLSNQLQFSQFFLHLSFIFLAAIIIKAKNMKNILILLLLLAASRIREIKIVTGELFNFGIFPFLAIASASFSLLIILIYPKKRTLALLLITTLVVVSLICSRPIIEQSLKPGYNYHVFWSYRQNDGEVIKILSRPEENVLIYPHDVDLYFFAQRQPPDRFLYWFPWTNAVDKYKTERLTALKENPSSVIYIGNLNFKDDPSYYAQFFPELLKDYERISKNEKETSIWLRKDLLNRLKNQSVLTVKE